MNKILLFTILAVILLSVSFTSVSALSPENEKKLNDKLKSLELKIKELVAENTKLKSENAKVKMENIKLKTPPVNTTPKTPPVDTTPKTPPQIGPNTADIDALKKLQQKDYSKITRWDFKNSRLNIEGLRIDILSFGWLESKPDQFSIDMEVQQTRGGMWGVYTIKQIKVTTDENFSFTANKTQFEQLNGTYEQNEKNRAIIKIDGIPKEFNHGGGSGKFMISITVIVEEDDGYGYLMPTDNMFKFEYNLKR